MIKSGKYVFKFFILFLISIYANAVEIVVNSNLDDPAVDLASKGPLTADNVITLRSAIQYANFIGGANSINFDIPGTGPFVLAIGTGTGVMGDPLPPIANTLTINGYTQPGSTVAKISNCPPALTVATILIILNGSAVTNGAFQDGLTLAAGSTSSVIQGLVIQGFPANGINILAGTSQRIVGNYIGVNQAGTGPIANGGNGITIAAGVSGVIIGSIATADRNVLSGQNSLIGSMPVSGVGVYTEGSTAQIIGNLIGTDASGTSSIPNRTGVYIFNPTPATPLNNTIKCNTVQNNNGSEQVEGFGVIVNGASANPILSNSIYNNNKSAIVFINDGNNNLPAPVITAATTSGATITVNGTLSSPANPNSTFRIEFFVNSANRAPITEGQTYVGQATVVTDGSGNAVFNSIRLPSNANPGQFVSATATLLNGAGAIETSPYSADATFVEGTREGALSTAIYMKYCNRNDFPCIQCS